MPKFRDKFYIKSSKKNLNKVYIIGKKTKFFAKLFKNKIDYKISYTISRALDNILSDIKNNKKFATILFSPAGASYDYFKNFEDRGNFFKKVVIKKLKN